MRENLQIISPFFYFLYITQRWTLHNNHLPFFIAKRIQRTQTGLLTRQLYYKQKTKYRRRICIERGTEISETNFVYSSTAWLLLFTHSVEFNSLQPHGLQHARQPCPLPSPGAWSYSCPFSQWCHPTISSSVIHFSSWLQFFPAPGSFLMSWLFALSGQNIETSVSAPVLPMNIQDLFSLWFTGLTSCCPRDSQESSPTPQFKSINSSALSFLCGPTLTFMHDYWKSYSFDYTDFCWQSNVSAF